MCGSRSRGGEGAVSAGVNGISQANTGVGMGGFKRSGHRWVEMAGKHMSTHAYMHATHTDTNARKLF